MSGPKVKVDHMTENDMQVYLSAALDQVACKATLTGALESRVASLLGMGKSQAAVIHALECLCDDPYQMNDDVIEDVIEAMRVV